MAVPFAYTRCLCSCNQLFGITVAHARRYASKKNSYVPYREKKFRVKRLFDPEQPTEPRLNERKKSVAGVPNYRALLESRRQQAFRSVLIQYDRSPEALCDLLDQDFGPINAAYSLNNVRNYLLVEFKHKTAADSLIRQTTFFRNADQIPIKSRLLYFMGGHSYLPRHGQHVITPCSTTPAQLGPEDYLSAKSVSSQMKHLHSVRQLSDAGSRLRFFICSTVEDFLRTCLPFCRVDPFGSASSGFGWEGCDLDMQVAIGPQDQDESQLGYTRFLTKMGAEEERLRSQRCLEAVGEMMNMMMPSAYQVHKVLRARIPIVKFHHRALGIDCDISYSNLSGEKMSELMYVLGELDPRVRVLVTSVKEWARSAGVTRAQPGRWPSNFTLLNLLIFYLQNCSPPVLPSLRTLEKLAGPGDHFSIDDVDYAFVTDVSCVAKSTNAQSLEDLLSGFFQYYSEFDFASCGLSLIEGSTFGNKSPTPIYIENPLSVLHNIALNMDGHHVSKLQAAMREGLQCLQTHSKPQRDHSWGLACLFHPVSAHGFDSVDSVDSDAADADGDGDDGDDVDVSNVDADDSSRTEEGESDVHDHKSHLASGQGPYASSSTASNENVVIGSGAASVKLK